MSEAYITCDCPAATRMREIGQELSLLTNERIEIEVRAKELKEAKRVVKKIKKPEPTEKTVNEMRGNGMTYDTISKHFGMSVPTLRIRRRNWESSD